MAHQEQYRLAGGGDLLCRLPDRQGPHDQYSIATASFRGRYVVIESVPKIYDSGRREWVLDRTSSQQWVIDTITKELVPMEVAMNPDWEPGPEYPHTWSAQIYDPDNPRKLIAAPGVLARWKDMTVIRDINGGVYLEKTGRQRLQIFHGGTGVNGDRGCVQYARFLGVDRISLVGCYPGILGVSVGSKSPVVSGLGDKEYKVPVNFIEVPPALNRLGTRFAVYSYYVAGWEWPKAILPELDDQGYEMRRIKVRVFSSSDGRKVFEYRWIKDKHEGDHGAPIALSDDGSLLVLVKGTEVLFFQIPTRSKM